MNFKIESKTIVDRPHRNIYPFRRNTTPHNSGHLVRHEIISRSGSGSRQSLFIPEKLTIFITDPDFSSHGRVGSFLIAGLRSTMNDEWQLDLHKILQYTAKIHGDTEIVSNRLLQGSEVFRYNYSRAFHEIIFHVDTRDPLAAAFYQVFWGTRMFWKPPSSASSTQSGRSTRWPSSS